MSHRIRRELLIPSLLAAALTLAPHPLLRAQQTQTQQTQTQQTQTQQTAAPGDTLQVFAPGVISADSGESFSTLSPDGREFYFTRHLPNWSAHRIMVSRYDGAKWTTPVTLPFSGRYNDREPKLSPDGKRMWFSSNRPVGQDTARRRDLDVWYVDRDAAGEWGTPQHPGAPINTSAQEFCPVVAANGTLYFVSTRAGGYGAPQHNHNVWRARFVNGRYEEPEPLGPEVNTGYETNVYVTSDERLLFLSRDGAPDGLGGDDLYGSEWRGTAWSAARNLGRPFNTSEYEYGPLLAPDMSFLYFTSHRKGGKADIYRAPFSMLREAFRRAEVRHQTRQSDMEGVRQAGLDYVLGFYEGDTVRLVRSIRPDVKKYGFDLPRGAASYVGEAMSFQEIIDYGKSVKARNRPVPADWPRAVEVLDVQDQTAVAKVTAWWGTDYLTLAKFDGRWMIMHVLWQSPPPR